MCVERYTHKNMRLKNGSNKGWNVWNVLERLECVSTLKVLIEPRGEDHTVGDTLGQDSLLVAGSAVPEDIQPLPQ
jgi:hypothetical protein